MSRVNSAAVQTLGVKCAYRRVRNSTVNNKSIFSARGLGRTMYIGYIRPLRIQRMCCPALGSCLGFMSGFLCRVVYTGAYVNADVIFFSTYSSHLNERARHICSIRNEPVGGRSVGRPSPSERTMKSQ